MASFFQKIPSHEKRITISTMVTLVRIALVPFIVGAILTQHWGTAFFLFVTASVTDVIDGYLARALNEQTFLGACLDPIADKLLLLSVFSTLAFAQSPLFTIPGWFVLIVLLRELIILSGAGIVYAVKGSLEVHPTRLGKATTLVQVLFVTWLFACYFFQWLPVKTYYGMLGLLLVMVIASCVQYVRMGVQQLRD